MFNGLVDHESAFVRRPTLVRAIYDDVAAATARPSDVQDIEEEVDRKRRSLRLPWRRASIS